MSCPTKGQSSLKESNHLVDQTTKHMEPSHPKILLLELDLIGHHIVRLGLSTTLAALAFGSLAGCGTPAAAPSPGPHHELRSTLLTSNRDDGVEAGDARNGEELNEGSKPATLHETGA